VAGFMTPNKYDNTFDPTGESFNQLRKLVAERGKSEKRYAEKFSKLSA
jgi:hypothetical protein